MNDRPKHGPANQPEQNKLDDAAAGDVRGVRAADATKVNAQPNQDAYHPYHPEKQTAGHGSNPSEQEQDQENDDDKANTAASVHWAAIVVSATTKDNDQNYDEQDQSHNRPPGSVG
jgi:hypothetical protein